MCAQNVPIDNIWAERGLLNIVPKKQKILKQVNKGFS
ncbi:MAG: hypothetical protein ACJAYN_002990 [Bermanella sp.]|jgi:hypothetical protein